MFCVLQIISGLSDPVKCWHYYTDAPLTAWHEQLLLGSFAWNDTRKRWQNPLFFLAAGSVSCQGELVSVLPMGSALCSWRLGRCCSKIILGENPELELKGLSKLEGTMIKSTAPSPLRITPLSSAEIWTPLTWIQPVLSSNGA